MLPMPMVAMAIVIASAVVCWRVQQQSSISTEHDTDLASGGGSRFVRSIIADRDGQPQRIAAGLAVLGSLDSSRVWSSAVLRLMVAVGSGQQAGPVAPSGFHYTPGGGTDSAAAGSGGVAGFLQQCVGSRNPCVVHGALDGAFDSWADGASILSRALGPDTAVHPLVVSGGVAANWPPSASFSQHDSEAAAMTIREFGEAAQAGRDALQLRLSLSDWYQQEMPAAPEDCPGCPHPPKTPSDSEASGSASTAIGNGDESRFGVPPILFNRSDCCLAVSGVWFELEHGPKAETWVGSKPSGVWLASHGSHTPLHNDPAESLLVQLSGEKEVLLLPPTVAAPLALVLHAVGLWTKAGGMMRWLAGVVLAQHGAQVVSLKPGEVLYIPAFWCVRMPTPPSPPPRTATGSVSN